MFNNETETFLKRWKSLLDCVMPGYVAEGKQQLAIAVGCTGGQHRSVYSAQHLAEHLHAKFGVKVCVCHREQGIETVFTKEN
jgi:UPF0042 nucleotide-binding protein